MVNESTIVPNKKAVGLLSLGHSVSDLYGGFIIPIMPVLALKLGMSLGVAGLILTISSISSSVLQPIWGHYSDTLKRRTFILFGLLLSTLICFAGWANSITSLIIIVFLGSLGVGLYHPQATGLAGHFSGHKIASYVGIYTACGTIGYALGPLFSSFLVENFGLNSTLLAVIPGFLCVFLMYFYLPKIPAANHIKAAKEQLKPLSKHVKRIIFTLSFVSIVRSISIASFNVYMPFLWKSNGLSLIYIGVLTSLFSIFGAIAIYTGGKLSRIYGDKKVLAFTMIPSIPTLLGTIYFTDKIPVLSFILYILSGFILTASSSVNIVMGQKIIPDKKAFVSGIIAGFCWGVAGLMLTPVGFLGQKIGIKLTLGLISLLPLLGLISVFTLPNNHIKD